jgi:hypothetical protein
VSVLAPPEPFLRAFLPVFQWAVPRFNHLLGTDGEVWPTSWWRSPAHNAAVGGARASQHLFGFAVDYDAPRDRRRLPSLAVEARRIGLIAAVETDHLHVQIFPRGTLEAAGLLRRA